MSCLKFCSRNEVLLSASTFLHKIKGVRSHLELLSIMWVAFSKMVIKFPYLFFFSVIKPLVSHWFMAIVVISVACVNPSRITTKSMVFSRFIGIIIFSCRRKFLLLKIVFSFSLLSKCNCFVGWLDRRFILLITSTVLRSTAFTARDILTKEVLIWMV